MLLLLLALDDYVQVMVANIRCNEIKMDQLRAFSSDQAWQTLEQASRQQLISGFGQQLSALMDSCYEG